jgi:isoquinoline 1-oxidoreductase alpha subunit
MVQFVVNGRQVETDADAAMPLLWFLRDELGLTGTKFGCGQALCGACTIHVNGAAVRGCQTTVSDAAGATVVTIEGLSPDGMHPVQVAWRKLNVPQCGYCQAGQIMQAVSFLKDNPTPTDQQISEAMYGNLCRCGTYTRIRSAIKEAASNMKPMGKGASL